MPFPFMYHLAPYVPKGFIIAASARLAGVLSNVTNSTDPIVIVKNVTATIAFASRPITVEGACKLGLLGSSCLLRVVVPTSTSTALGVGSLTQVIRSYYP